MLIPRHVRALRDALLAVDPAQIFIPGITPSIVGHPGIRVSTRIENNKKDFQQLGRRHEYTFALADGHKIELSLQLYHSAGVHWRLFAYSVVDDSRQAGMLLSVNLTLSHDGSNILPIKQKLKLATRGVTTDDRSHAVELLASRLRGLGFGVTEDRDIVFSSFDTRTGEFVETSARAFVRDFIVAAVLKGHYMGNKGYELPGLDEVAQPDLNLSSTDALLEAAEDAVADEGAFDPYDQEDARKRIIASIVRRRGQREFRQALIDVYDGKCAVTGCDFEDALEAAHISPYRGDHTNDITNGLLLRADIHTLFDLGHIAVDSGTMKVHVAARLKGTVYQELAGKVLAKRKAGTPRPSPEALDKHRREAGL